MTDRIIENDQQLQMLLTFLRGHKQPFTVSIVDGKHRTTKQNRLQRQWVNEIAEQQSGSFESAEAVRGYCKLCFGVPILRNENEAFRIEYDQIMKPLPYEAKLKLMMVPFDFGVTRIMNTKQKNAYLDAVHKHFAEQGVILTDPGDLLFQEPAASQSRSGADAAIDPTDAAETDGAAHSLPSVSDYSKARE